MRKELILTVICPILILLIEFPADQDVAMMFEPPANIEPTQAIHATSESFAEVVRLLEEEKSTLERKLDTATKVGVSVRVRFTIGVG
jgi:hypothetical protein